MSHRELASPQLAGKQLASVASRMQVREKYLRAQRNAREAWMPALGLQFERARRADSLRWVAMGGSREQGLPLHVTGCLQVAGCSACTSSL